MALHADELGIDDRLVRHLLRTQAPALADRPFERLETTGTVHVLYRIDDVGLLRLPRTVAFRDGPRRAVACIAAVGPAIPLAVPEVLVQGAPSEAYPSHWSIVEWIEGRPADEETLDDPSAAAVTLGAAIRSLRRVDPRAAPPGGTYRSGPLAAVDDDVRRWIDQLPPDIDRATVVSIWDRCRSVAPRSGPPTWLHGDLRGDNLIARAGRLVGIIDWDGATVGDPSVDLLAAWWLFEGGPREVFRSATGASLGEWERARGWALQMAVAAIPYYRDTNPGFASQARRALERILSDDDDGD